MDRIKGHCPQCGTKNKGRSSTRCDSCLLDTKCISCGIKIPKTKGLYCYKCRLLIFGKTCDYDKCLNKVGKHTNFCRVHAVGENCYQWKGGSYLDANGYKYIKNDHPNSRKNRYVAEHHLVMSMHLGRPIDTKHGEEVHHKNGIRDDNRIENLELWTISQPPGQRIDDRVEWYLEELKIYIPEGIEEINKLSKLFGGN